MTHTYMYMYAWFFRFSFFRFQLFYLLVLSQVLPYRSLMLSCLNLFIYVIIIFPMSHRYHHIVCFIFLYFFKFLFFINFVSIFRYLLGIIVSVTWRLRIVYIVRKKKYIHICKRSHTCLYVCVSSPDSDTEEFHDAPRHTSTSLLGD